MSRYTFLIAVILFCFNSYGQEEVCGTVATTEDIRYIDRFIKSTRTSINGRQASNVASVNIPIKFHFIVENEGDLGATNEQAEALLSQINSIYASAKMSFFHVGDYNRIVDPDNYNFNSPNEGAVAVGNQVRNVVNVYFFGTAAVNGSPVCGYTNFPGQGSDRIIVAYGCTLGGATTLEHELGHYFSLYHTHGKTNNGTTDELVDGSNCNIAGDDICDTPADPNLAGKVTNCSYGAGEKDANGDIFKPNPANIMAYSPDECQNLFTSGQYDRIRRGFEFGRNYLDFTTDDLIVNFSFSSSDGCVGDQITFTANGFGIDSWQWEFKGGEPATSTDPNPTVTYNSGGLFSVTLTGTGTSGESVSFTRNNLIFIDDPLSRVIDEAQVNAFNENSFGSNITVDNPDNFITFELVDVNSSIVAGSSLLVDNFNYDAQNLPQTDRLQLLPLQTSGLKGVNVSLKAAYQARIADNGDGNIENVYDSLNINVKTNCSSSGIALIQTGGVELAGGITNPVPTTSSERYVPQSPDEWITLADYYELTDEDEFIAIDIESICYNGNSLYIDDIEIIPDYSLDAPSDLVATSDQNTVSLTWVDNSTNELGFIVERSINNGEFQQLGETGIDVVEFTDEDITSGEIYTYRVIAKGYDVFASQSSNEVVVETFVLSVRTEQTIKVFPNPVIDYLQVIDAGYDASFNIYDFTGRKVRSGKLENGKIDFTTLNNGIYFLDINNNSKFKIIK